MQQGEFGVPAGDESDDSCDEWDVGYSYKISKLQNTAFTGPKEAEALTLKRAISEGNVQVVQMLLDSGVSVESRLRFDWTLLMGAVYRGHYKLAKLLLDRGASSNYSKNQFTVLMAACTALVPEAQMAQCVQLLLSRNADPNVCSQSRMTALMMAAKNGYCQVTNLLVSHGAQLNARDCHGFTALTVAVQYGKQDAVLRLLQLGADKNVKMKDGRSALDLAKGHRDTQISQILMGSREDGANSAELLSKEDAVMKFFRRSSDPPSVPLSCSRLTDIELFLHGLDLERLGHTLENDLSWTYLATTEKDDLHKLGIRDPEDQKKILNAVANICMDAVDMKALTQLNSGDSNNEQLYTFLVNLRQQYSYITEVLQDIIRKFPKHSSQLVLTLDPKGESRTVCSELLLQIEDLRKEVTCLRALFDKMNPGDDPCGLAQAARDGSSGKRRVLMKCVAAVLGTGLFLLLSRAIRPRILI